MKKFKKILSFVLAGVMLVGITGCSSASKETSKDAEAQTVLTWGTNAEFPPYEFREGNKVVGIDAEIMDAVAEKLGMTAQVEDMNFDSIIVSVQSGKVDLGVAGMTITEDRAKMVNFTEPYAKSTQVIIVKEGSEIKDVTGLEGKNIGVQLGTTGDIYSADIKDANIQKFNKYSEAIIALTQDKVEAVIVDAQPAKKFVEANEGIIILDEPLTEEEYAIAVAKDNTELLEKVNGALAELKESGELQAIIDKYITAE